MTTERIGPPATEPVSLAEAKAFLRVDGEAEDELIASLIGAARARIERAAGRAMIAQDWRVRFDALPPGRVLALPVRPVLAVTAVRIADAGGVLQPLDEADYEVDAAGGRVAIKAAVVPGRRLGGIEVDVSAGYGAAASSVPEDLRQAVRLLVADAYANRGDAATERAGPGLPAAAAALIAPFRKLRLLP